MPTMIISVTCLLVVAGIVEIDDAIVDADREDESVVTEARHRPLLAAVHNALGVSG